MRYSTSADGAPPLSAVCTEWFGDRRVAALRRTTAILAPSTVSRIDVMDSNGFLVGAHALLIDGLMPMLAKKIAKDLAAKRTKTHEGLAPRKARRSGKLWREVWL